MALIKCKECNQQISSLAMACPSCGCPIKGINKVNKSAIRKGLIIIFIPFILGIFLYLTNTRPSSTNNIIESESSTTFEEHSGKLKGDIITKEVQDQSVSVSCKDLSDYKGEDDDPRQRLAIEAKLKDDYWNRYHESVWFYLCNDPIDINGIDSIVDRGYVNALEVESIAKVLGKPYKAITRTEDGRLYEIINQKLSNLGLCTACSSNLASAYVDDKKIGHVRQIVDGALSGNKSYIFMLKNNENNLAEEVYRDEGARKVDSTSLNTDEIVKTNVLRAENEINRWVEIPSAGYWLKSSNSRHVFLVADNEVSTNKIMISILNNNQEICKEDGTTSDIGNNRVYKINGRSIRVHGLCINGNELEVPDSNEEKDYLVSLVSRTQKILIERDNTNELNFESADFASVRNHLEGH
ncbi:hypothetical protein LBMAG29_08490 [Methylophilaceae bacterium]|nr:hypothetical protein LBMAG29_08490 [Methylophilaceae bacterium]